MTELNRYTSYILAGALTGTVATLFSTPTEMVKIQTQMQSRSASKTSVGSLATANLLLRNHGLSAFYTGFSISASLFRVGAVAILSNFHDSKVDHFWIQKQDLMLIWLEKTCFVQHILEFMKRSNNF